MYYQLDLWRSNAAYIRTQPQQQQQQQQQQAPPSKRPVGKEDSFDISYVLQMLDDKDAATTPTPSNPAPSSGMPQPSTSGQGMVYQHPVYSPPVGVPQQMATPPPPYPAHRPGFDMMNCPVAAPQQPAFDPLAVNTADYDVEDEDMEGESSCLL